jgi:secreted Zn-dependent insulinase-like peptidase
MNTYDDSIINNGSLPNKIILGTRILSQSFFDNLRTKKQLGYLVNMGMSAYRNKYYVTQKIQSDKSVEIILENINEFNSKVEKYLMESEFNKYVESIKKELLEPEYSLSDKVTKYLPEITNHEYIFDRRLILSKQIDKITKQREDVFKKQLEYQETMNKLQSINNPKYAQEKINELYMYIQQLNIENNELKIKTSYLEKKITQLINLKIQQKNLCYQNDF